MSCTVLPWLGIIGSRALTLTLTLTPTPTLTLTLTLTLSRQADTTGKPADFGAWLFSTNLALTTLGIAAWLHQAGGWRVLPSAVRRVLVHDHLTFNPP